MERHDLISARKLYSMEFSVKTEVLWTNGWLTELVRYLPGKRESSLKTRTGSNPVPSVCDQN